MQDTFNVHVTSCRTSRQVVTHHELSSSNAQKPKMRLPINPLLIFKTLQSYAILYHCVCASCNYLAFSLLLNSISMGKFKKPEAVVKCYHCGRLFVNERSFGQHLNSKAHDLVINHDEDNPSIVCIEHTDFGTPLSHPSKYRPRRF